MKKKTVKTVVPVEIDTSLNGTDNKEVCVALFCENEKS